MLDTANVEINQDVDSDDPLRSPLTIKPLFVMARWRHPKTRDGRLAIFIVLPTGALDKDDEIRTELETAEQLSVTFAWPSVLFDADKIMRAVCSFCTELNDGQGPLLAQGLRDYTDPLQTKEGQDVYSKCVITLPHPVKPDFSEDVLRFDGNDSTSLYMLRFEAFEQKFSMTKKRLTIRTFGHDNCITNPTALICSQDQVTVAENSVPNASAITEECE